MNVRSFIDSNILVYTDDASAPEKRLRAIELCEQARLRRLGVISTQVLQEYFVATTRKLRVEPALARRKVELFAKLEVVQVDTATILAAIDLQILRQLSFRDALIVQAAIASGCRRLLSEDMQAGARISGIEIVDPFAGGGAA